MPFDEIIKGEYIKVRFGFLPKASYARMMVAYAENPHVLFVTCSEDKGGYWGIYFTPLRNADEIDGIFATLFFERLHLPEASGTPESIVKQLGEGDQRLPRKRSSRRKKRSPAAGPSRKKAAARPISS